MLKYTLLGVLLVAITMVIHAVGTTFWLLHLGRKMRAVAGPRRMGSTLNILAATVVILTVLHTIQVLIWALAYMFLLPETVLHTFEEATYFSFVTFTTLGYGDITFDGIWRVLSAPIELLPDNRVRVAINIIEGERAKIRQVNVVGNTSFDDDEILDTFELKTGNLLSFIRNDDRYSTSGISRSNNSLCFDGSLPKVSISLQPNKRIGNSPHLSTSLISR